LVKLKRREVLILAALWIVVGGLICGVTAWLLASRPAVQLGLGEPTATPSPAPTYTVQFVQVTARQLYPAAEALARAWEPDAQLAGVNASWPATAVDQVGNPTDWSYRFYSPARSRLYLVGVSSAGQAVGMEHLGRETSAPSVINLDKWKVDSSEAIAHWLDNGGGALLSQSANIEVTMQLGVEPEAGQTVWFVTGSGGSEGQGLALKVDAATGQTSVWQPLR
jgi:hypothetical protein